MKNAGVLLLAVALMLVSTGDAFAAEQQSKRATIDQRQAKQMSRIGQGVKSGELTRREAANLLKREAQINKMERRVRADGVVTNQERLKIQAAQNHSSKAIYDQNMTTRIARSFVARYLKEAGHATGLFKIVRSPVPGGELIAQRI